MPPDKEHNCINDEKFLSDIEKYGWIILMIEGTAYLPSFAYTAGLWKNYRHPEIISFGLTTETLHSVLNDAAAMIKSGQVMETSKTYNDFFENSSTQFIGVDPENIADYFGYDIELYKTRDFPAMQLVWTDQNDHFPWDATYEEEFRFWQPLLDRNAAFKFREEKDLGIFTTRQWLELGKPILRVVHDEDGAWQFLTGDQLPEDARLVALEQMTIRDKTLNEVFNLDYGEAAEREYIGGKWTRTTGEDCD